MCVCGNGIYTKHVTLNTKHLNIPLNKALAIRPINVKWKKRLGKNAVSLWSFKTFLRNVFWDVHTCSRLNKNASTPQKGKKCILTNVCSFVHIVFTPKKVFNLVSWREHSCNWWEIHRFDYDCLCFLMSPLWAPAFISDKSIFPCSFSPASFSSFRCLFRFLFFSRLCLPSILK